VCANTRTSKGITYRSLPDTSGGVCEGPTRPISARLRNSSPHTAHIDNKLSIGNALRLASPQSQCQLEVARCDGCYASLILPMVASLPVRLVRV
jgi:hypothetical protein